MAGGEAERGLSFEFLSCFLADGAARGVDAVRALCVVADDRGSCSPKNILARLGGSCSLAGPDRRMQSVHGTVFRSGRTSAEGLLFQMAAADGDDGLLAQAGSRGGAQGGI